MKKLCYILLAMASLYCVSLLDKSEAQTVCADAQGYMLSESVDNDFREELICCRECNGDMMLRTQRSFVTVGQNNLTSSNHNVRSRSESHDKYLVMAFHESHTGHVTRIFEFNHFKSSLRVVYYLYVLCRLRI